MKQKYIYMLSVAALLATACTDDLGVQDIPVESGKGHLVKVGANMTPESRMTIENTGTDINYYWTADDSFTVFDFKHSQQTIFTVDKDSLGEKSVKASFLGTPETAYEDGQTLYAVYNKKDEVTLDANGNVVLDLTGQNGRLNENYQYMWGNAIYKEGESAQFLFRHLVTTLQVKIAVPEGVTSLSNITLHSANLVSKATLVLNEAPYDSERQFKVGDLVYSYTDNGYFEYGEIELEGTFTPVDGYVTLYFYTLPSKQYYDNTTWSNQPYITPSILYTDQDGTEYVSTDFYYGKSMEVGAVYSLDVNKSLELEDFANEASVDGSTTHPYEIANAEQLYTMMLRCYHRLSDKHGNLYWKRSYRLMNDVVLDNRTGWYPVDLEYANFDGNEKTISGKLVLNVNGYVGFFRKLREVTLSDLTLDADITFDTRGIQFGTTFGVLAAEIRQDSKMLRCFNNSRVVIIGNELEGAFGGLVGNLGSRSSVEYCGFSGSIISEENYACIVGGIVGSNSSSSSNNPIKVIGCYSDGTFQFGKMFDFGYFGGIFGQMSGDPNAIITNCWSSATINIVSMDESQPYTWGGIVGMSQDTHTIASCYWSNAILNWAGADNGCVAANCASFEGTMPTPEQLKELNTGILASGLVFSEENGHLVKNNHTVVPPSDIENW